MEGGKQSDDPGHRGFITKNRVWLIQSIDVMNTLILDHLVQDEVMSPSQLVALKERNPTNDLRMSALLDHLFRRTSEDWKKFIHCLSTRGHNHVVQEIEISERRQTQGLKPGQIVSGAAVTEAGKFGSKSPLGALPADPNPQKLQLVGSWQLQVARHYRRYHSHIDVCPHGPYRREQELESLFIPPSCTLLQKENRSECEIGDIHDIFRNTGEPTSTFITGLPGSGKSTLVNWCLSSWADLVRNKSQTATPGGESSNKPDFMYDIVLCLFLRYVQPDQTFSQAIRKQIWCDPNCYPDIDKYISENPSRVLFIFDGLDEFRPEISPEISAIIKGELFPNVSKIVTSRHTKADSPSDELVRHYDKRVQINGFDDSRILTYIYKYKRLPVKPQQTLSPSDLENQQFVDKLYEKIKAKNMLSICHIPLHLCFFCQLAEAGRISKNKTELYLFMLKYSIDAYMSKAASRSDFSIDNIHVYHDELVLCGTGALNLLRSENDRFTFSKETTENDSSEEFIELGIKFGLIIPVQPEHLGDTKLYTFSHLSIQENLAAFAIVHNQTQRQLFISYLTNIFRLHDCRNIISFCCGMSEQCGNELLSHAVKLVRNSKDRSTAHQCPYFNPVAWHSGKVDWKAEVTTSSNISFFVAQCVAEFKDPNLCDIPLPASITLDLSQPETDAMLTMFRHNKSQSAVSDIVIKNGDLSRDIWETTTSVIQPHELKQLYLTLTCIEDTAVLAASINQMTNLTYLKLEIQSLTETDSERILAAIPQTISLVRLILGYFRLSPHGADLLSNFVRTQQRLSCLSVPDTDLSLLGPRVTSLLTSRHLALLEIVNNHVTRQQVTSLCTALPGQCPQLLLLTMSGNDISGVEDRVAEAVSKLNHLSWLSIRNCNITSQGLWRILQHLPDSLRVLNICNNGFTHFSRLSECCHFLKYVRFLLCLGTAVPAEVMQELVQVCDQNLPDLKLMYDGKSYQAGKQAYEAFTVELFNEITARQYSVD